MTKQFSNYSDLLTYTRASEGHALRPVSYGDELVTSGTFNDSSALNDWSLERSADVSVSGGVATFNAVSGVNSLVQQLNLTVGKIYLASIEITASTQISNATFQTTPNSDGTNFESLNLGLSGTGTFLGAFVATSSDVYLTLNAGNNDSYSFDNISVKEVLFDQPDGTLTLFEHPNNVPRVEYDADGNRLGLLVEEARTNLVAYSEDLTHSEWTKTGATVTPSTTIAPNGVAGCSRVQFLSGGAQNNRHVQDIVFPSPLASVTHTVSVWVKSTSGADQTFALKCTHGSVLDYFSADFTATSEWQRFDFSQAFGTGGSGAIVGIVVGSGGDAADLEVWGFQFEGNASFPTSYIKTTGSTATRSADVASIPVADFGFNTGAGTFVAEFDFTDPENDDSNYVVAGTSSARIIYNNAGNSLWQTYDGNAAVTFGELDNTGASRFKAAVGVKTGKDAVTVLDGDVKGSSTSATSLMENLAGVTLYVGGGGTQSLNGHIKKLMYIPRRVTNAQLISLTE